MQNSPIEWTDHTWSPWEGCEKVSPGCKNCYAEDRDKRYHGAQHWGPNSTRLEHTETYWKQPLRWDREAAKAGRIARVFCQSLGDILELGPHLAPIRTRVWDLVEQTPNLMWLFLTKRPENFRMFRQTWLDRWPRNAMLGMTGENQEWFEKRARFWAAELPGHVPLFLSAEPLLGPLEPGRLLPMFSWVICGGESGSNARAMHPDWARKLRDDCAATGVPFLFKQWGEFGHSGTKLGKHIAGRLLDGVEHNGLPLYWPPNVVLLPKSDPLAVLA